MLCKPVPQSLLVMFSPAISPEPSLTKRKTDMQSCVCPALMDQAHCKFDLSTRYQRSPTSRCSHRPPQLCFSPSHLLFLPLKIHHRAASVTRAFFRGSCCFLQLGITKQRRRRRSNDVPRGHTDHSEAHLGPWPPQPPKAVHELWGQTGHSGTSLLLGCPCQLEHSSSL